MDINSVVMYMVAFNMSSIVNQHTYGEINIYDPKSEKEQGYKITVNVIYQYNQSAIKLENNGI